MIAGSSAPGMLLFSTESRTNSPVMSRSRQTPEMVHARIRMISAGTMDLTPSPMPPMKSRNRTTPRGTKSRNATTSAPNPPSTSASAATQFPNAAPIEW